ncbi:hypothetical protein KY289_026665 [Solanum tuberosum]|nr:hypothetical protein KY289_026665 [Solanum tuberosum]
MSTGLPIEIKSSMKSENYTSFCRLDIDNYKKTKTGGMVLKSRLSLKGTGQRTDEEIGRSKFNPMIGLGDHERRDEALYIGFETAKAREKRLAKEARVLEIQAKNVALGKNVKDPAATKAAKGREALYYRVTCNVSSVSLCSSIC